MKPSQRKPAVEYDSPLPVIQDPRFARVHNDPRFSRPRKQDAKIVVDDRFKSMLESDEFIHAPRVDQYGRRRKTSNRVDELKRYYRLDKDHDEEDQEDHDAKDPKAADEADDKDQASDDGSSKTSEKALPDSDDEESDKDDEETDEIRLKAKSEMVDRARGIGILDDSESSSSSSDSEDEPEADIEVDASSMAIGPYALENVPTGDESRRFAAVNLDWDHVKAADLYKVFDGFVPKEGRLLSVKIYPSDFGLERLAKEYTEGPPSDIFKKGQTMVDDEEEEELSKPLIQGDEGQEFENENLRKYQMERMRYYYAVVEADSAETAKSIYVSCDGVEYEKTANYFDLRYIPDDMDFTDREIRDEALEVPRLHRPATFTTSALQNSKVKLTWDEDDPDRSRVTRKKFSKQDLMEMDFKTYIASESSDGEGPDDNEDDSDVEERRNRYKALLEGGDEESNPFGRSRKSGMKADADGMGDMEITFTPGLTSSKGDEPQDNESPFEQYLRKQKEKRKAKKDARKAATSQKEEQSEEDEVPSSLQPQSANSLQLLLDDDFSTPGLVSNSSPSETSQQPPVKSSRHFDMKEIIKAEKLKTIKLKGKAKKKLEGRQFEALQDDFELNLEDPRFSAVTSSHHFAIDPSNPHFKKTPAMKKLLQSRREEKPVIEEPAIKGPESISGGMDVDLKSLVASVKRKSNEPKQPRVGKRMKPTPK
ncbi:hypothetical protein SmJEL517_g00324 [Synchytrium microbalum]|uniref:Uncharacterized protein n=1 Tax=Synchytrium microbalum TaxID=1806994 RepID=A0A507CKA6_9FUNG|nr:uncharacterized protein SmJEL517_g00324 [Synchytrium microbalum]TPX38335.1 hypothetical protein SmJEL517_g00324 [Synchytrium microbalum]